MLYQYNDIQLHFLKWKSCGNVGWGEMAVARHWAGKLWGKNIMWNPHYHCTILAAAAAAGKLCISVSVWKKPCSIYEKRCMYIHICSISYV